MFPKPFMYLAAGLITNLVTPSNAFWVVQCYSRLFDERADPIVSPGKVSSHVHAIAGGNGFNFTMDYAQARSSECTTCNIKEDLSNYWTPKLYYHAENGSFISVPIDGDVTGDGVYGGMAIYYLDRPGPDKDKLHPFPKGFRMLAGDPSKRHGANDFAGLAVNQRCIGTPQQTTHFPNRKCPGGIRMQVTFPSCWDGKNLDSPDHKSHVAYPKDGNFDGGRCPKSHPVHLMTLFYEVTYRTDQFDDMWYGDKQPFVLANGDPTGYSFHGDFVNGWNIPTLTSAINDCYTGATQDCPDKHFTYNSQGDTQNCKLPPQVNEKVEGVLEKLPGCNPVSMTPKTPTTCAADNVPIGAKKDYVDLTKSKHWKYLGCGTDDLASRTLTPGWKGDDKMTVQMCVSYCKSQGYKYAGLEYSTECYCGNTLAASRRPKAGMYGNCGMPCGGNSGQICGGSAALSLYHACPANGPCRNADGTGVGVTSRIRRQLIGHRRSDGH